MQPSTYAPVLDAVAELADEHLTEWTLEFALQDDGLVDIEATYVGEVVGGEWANKRVVRWEPETGRIVLRESRANLIEQAEEDVEETELATVATNAELGGE